MSKTVVTTGTSSGLGLETAVLFAQQVHRVYATMHNIGKHRGLKTALAKANVTTHVLPRCHPNYLSNTMY